MIQGKVIGIYIAEIRGGDTVAVEQVKVVPGKGIEGDRYFDYMNNPSIDHKPGKEITLIESEMLESMDINDGIKLLPNQTRRNLLTSGISLNDLVGKTFFIGDIKLQGIRLCEPCQYLADRTDQRILTSMVHKGGLRSDILSEGIIHINDDIITAD
jgi:MOSC domain-containing protein YiiM